MTLTRKAPKAKTCEICGTSFTPASYLQAARVCSPQCGGIAGRAKTEAIKKEAIRSKRKADAAERKADAVKRESQKSRSLWIAEAQTAFNAYVRARDVGQPCICCGRTSHGDSIGGTWDAGHYRSRGSSPHLRFDERNCHAQLKHCNRYLSGNVVGYRAGLIQRIGLETVEALEADQAPRKLSIDDLKAVKATYTAKAKELKAAQT